MVDFDIALLQPHPFTEIVARVPKTSDEYKELERSICKFGLFNPIVIYDKQILCGLTRTEILRDHLDEDIPVKFEVFNGNDEEALQLLIDENMARRHLDENERAMAAARLVRFHPKHKLLDKNEKWASEIFKVGQRSVKRALELFKANRQDLIDAVDKRLLNLANAAPCVTLPVSAVKQIVESENPNANATKLVKETNRQSRQLDMARTAVKETRETVDQSLKFGVIYADPPWAFETYSDKGKGKSAENHYPTMSIEEIQAIELPASSSCALFLWTTVPFLDQAIDTLKRWGFEYKSCYGWHKLDKGTGYWSRNNLELLLLGIKGDVPAPMPEQLGDQCLTVKQGEHSAKPEVFADMITKMFPDVLKLEMFARRTDHAGENWYYWGNEVGKEVEIITKETPAKGKKGKRKPKENQAETNDSTELGGTESVGNTNVGSDQLGSDLQQGS